MDHGPGSGRPLLPHLQLDELLGELQSRVQAVMTTRDRMNGLLEAVVAIGSDLDLEAMLRRIVEAAIKLTEARYGALGVIGEGGRLAEFLPVGLSDAEISQIDHWPQGEGILGLLIRDPRPRRIADLGKHPDSSGFPAGHPPMSSFLGVPVMIRGEVFGNLYLTEKAGGAEFTADDETIVCALAAAAGVAIENARLFGDSERQQRWLQASSQLTTRLLSGADPAEVLAEMTRQTRELSGADLAVLALPEEDKRRLIVGYAEGEGAETARGLVLMAGKSLSGQVLDSGQPVAVDNFAGDDRAARAARTAMSQIGPAVVFPLGAPGNVRGVLTIGRVHGLPPFPPASADVASSFAAQAGIALELAEHRRDSERLSVLADRDRIARELHDQVIQRLYAIGMSLQGIVPIVARPEVLERVQGAIDSLDQTVKSLRSAIFALQYEAEEEGESLRAQILAVVDEMTPMLGFVPALRLGISLDRHVSGEQAENALPVVREALSTVARHAGATRVDLTAEADGDLMVRVADDGTGIPADVRRRSGLANLAERAERLGGTLQVSPADEAARTGTVLEWRVPLNPAGPGA